VSTPSRHQTIGNQIVVDPRTGALYDFFDLITPPFNVNGLKLAFIKSTDGGNTWTNEGHREHANGRRDRPEHRGTGSNG